MVDFSMKPSFPISSVIDAAQRQSILRQQMEQKGYEDLQKGFSDIATVADSLMERKRKVAQALALGRQFDIPDEISKTMEPAQILQVGTVKKGSVDMNMLLNLLHPGFSPGGTAATAPSPAPATPAAPVPATPAVAQPSVMPEPSVGQPLTPPTTSQVPIAAPSVKPPMVNPGTLNAAVKLGAFNKPESVFQYIPGQGLKKVGEKNKGDQVVTSQPGAKLDDEYDKLENQVITRIVGIRGDKSLARTEEQRDAAIQAYNTIATVRKEGRLPNQLEYYDIIGQMWKARTGQSPTDQAIRDLDAKTLKGDLGKAYQYFSGDAAPRTTEGIMDAIQSFADTSGKQADKLHSGYMQSHLVKPKNMSQKDFDSIVQAHRGLTFEEATAESRIPHGSLSAEQETRYQELLAKKNAGTIQK